MAASTHYKALFTVGGYTFQKQADLDKVAHYSIEQNKWKQLVHFPEKICYNAVCVLKEKWL